MKLALRQFHATNHLKNVHVNLDILDSGAGPQAGVTNAQKLVSAHVVAALADMSSDNTLPEEPIFARAGIPQIAESSNPSITQRGYRTIFQLTASDNFQGGSMATFLAHNLHLHSVAVFNDGESFGTGVTNAFTQEAKQLAVSVQSTTALDPTSSDYTSALAPVLAKHPQAIYYGGNLPPAGILCRQARSAGFNGPFLGVDVMFVPTFISACGSDIGKVYLTFESPPYTYTSALKSFARSYAKAFHTTPGSFSVYGYDDAGFLLTALDKVGWSSEPTLITALHNLTYQGLFGPEHPDASGALPDAPMFIYTVKSGKYKLVTQMHSSSSSAG